MNDDITLPTRPTRLPPGLLDALLAGAVLVLLSIGALVWAREMPPAAEVVLVAALTALQGLPLLIRRRAPILALALTAGSFLAHEPLAGPITPLGYLVALYSVGVYAARRASFLVIGIGLPLVLAYLGARILFITERISWSDVVTFALFSLAVWAVGNGAGARRAYLHSIEERAALLERQRDEKAQQAVAAERARIARELHDVVAHHVSMMVVQSGAARRVIDTDTDGARRAIESVEATGRQALTEMRRLLGVLRADQADAARAPQPGLGQVAELVEQARAAGITIDLKIDGEPRALAPLLDLSAYRIVQEAITNVVKHAGPATASVTIRYGEHDVTIEVIDDGRGRVDDTPGIGHGLVGMRERAALFDGDLHAGPRVGGGFVVRARLPYEATA